MGGGREAATGSLSLLLVLGTGLADERAGEKE